MSTIFRKPMENYQGRHIGCAPGTHAALVDMVRRNIDPSSRVMDIGAHSGALLLRLQTLGFSDLVGTDLDNTRFDVPGAEFCQLDLNYPFFAKFSKNFHLITATEVIEHLDSPREFLTQIRRLLDVDGWLAISLPNVGFWEGRLKFLIKGELWGFGENNYRTQRHISPITPEQMILMMQEIGFKVIEFRTAGSFATVLKTAISFPLWLFFRLIGGSSVIGESAIYLARKADPDPDLKRPMHYRNRWQGVADRIGINAES